MKIEQDKLNKDIEFLKETPHFKHWSKNAISKLTYYFQRMECQKNQYIFKEGEEPNYIYIVLEGEFALIKGVMNFKKEEDESFINKLKHRKDFKKDN